MNSQKKGLLYFEKEDKLANKEERGLVWIFGIVLVCIGFLLWIGYLFSATHLRFRRDLGFHSDDFNFPLTNTFNTVKWWFIVFLPIGLGPFAFLFLIILLHYIYITDSTTKDKFYFQTNMIVLLIYIGILLTSVVFSSIELGYANKKQHPLNVASDIRFCCAVDVFALPPGRVDGCPYIDSCGITPVSMHQLTIDTYFVLTFVFNVGLIITCLLAIYIVFNIT